MTIYQAKSKNTNASYSGAKLELIDYNSANIYRDMLPEGTVMYNQQFGYYRKGLHGEDLMSQTFLQASQDTILNFDLARVRNGLKVHMNKHLYIQWNSSGKTPDDLDVTLGLKISSIRNGTAKLGITKENVAPDNPYEHDLNTSICVKQTGIRTIRFFNPDYPEFASTMIADHLFGDNDPKMYGVTLVGFDKITAY